jgi:hypothetical protein
VNELLRDVQAVAFERRLALPPQTVTWFALSQEPAYARIRAVWAEEDGCAAASSAAGGAATDEEEGGAPAGSGTGDCAKRKKKRKPAALARPSSSVIVAVQLMHSDALDADVALLHELAAAARARAAASKSVDKVV